MDRFMLTLAVGFASFMLFVAWCIYKVMKTANDEDPGSIDPRHH